MIGNNNDDYDDYAGDDETKTVPLSCEDDYEKDFEEKSVLRKMIEYKSDSLFGVLYEVSSILGFSLVALIGLYYFHLFIYFVS